MNEKESLYYTLDKMGATPEEVLDLAHLFRENKINGRCLIDEGQGGCLIGNILQMRGIPVLGNYYKIFDQHTVIIESYIEDFTPDSDDDFLLEERLNVVTWLLEY